MLLFLLFDYFGGFLGVFLPFVIEQVFYYEMHSCWFDQ